MTEFIKVCTAIGLFTLYVGVTGVPGLFGYHFLKHTTVDKPVDFDAAAKSMLISYAIGLAIFIGSAVHFVLLRG